LKEGDVAPEFSAATSGGNGDLPVWTGCVRPPHRQHLVPALIHTYQTCPSDCSNREFYCDQITRNPCLTGRGNPENVSNENKLTE